MPRPSRLQLKHKTNSPVSAPISWFINAPQATTHAQDYVII